MPPPKEDIITSSGLWEDVDRIRALNPRLNAKSIVWRLNKDRDALVKLATVGRTRINVKDLLRYFDVKARQHFQDRDIGVSLTSPGGALAADDVVSSVQNRIRRTDVMWDQWISIGTMALSETRDELMRFQDEKRELLMKGDSEGMKALKFPIATVEMARKAILASIDIVKAVRDDKELKTLINAKKLTINNGISPERLNAVVIRMGEILNIPRPELLSAFAEAISKSALSDDPEPDEGVTQA